MDEQQERPTNVQVVGAAGAAAGTLAGLALALGRWREDEPRTATVARLPEEAQVTVEGAKERWRGTRRRVAEDVADAGETAKARGRKAARFGRRRAERLVSTVDTDTAAVGSAVGAEVDRLRHRAGEMADRGGRLGHDVADKAKAQAKRVGEQTSATAQSIAEQAAAAAVAGAERAREVGTAVADAAKERVPQVTHKVGEEVVPSLREVALQAAAVALELWQTARERAAESDLAPQAAHAVAAGGERAREATAAVSEKASELGERASELGERARDASRRTAEATVETSKDTGAMLFWAGAAAGLVFYALLTPERREQVLRTAQSVTTQVQELIKDFQGYDDEF
jgi:hypothetical protein